MLAGVTGVITTAYDGVHRLGANEQQRLYAAEVAHRLILNYLLDPESLPKEGEKIPYSDEFFYRHELTEQLLVKDDADADAKDENVDVRKPVLESSLSQNDRLGAGLKMVTVKIYHLPNTGYSNVDTPLATLSRIYSPVDPTKDEDIFLKQVQKLYGRQFEIPSAPTPAGNRRR